MIAQNPAAWWLLLLAIPIIFSFFRSKKPRQKSVATLLFWQPVLTVKHSDSWRQCFPPLFSLLLSLTIFCLFVAAILDLSFVESKEPKPLTTENADISEETPTFFSNSPQQQILFFGTDHFFLRTVLESQPNRAVTILPSENDILCRVPDNAVLVLHRFVPPVLPQGSVLILDPQTNCDLFEVGEKIQEPKKIRKNRKSPVMCSVDLNGVHLVDVRPLRSRSAFETVLAETADGQPIFVEWRLPGQHVIAFSADLTRSELVRRTAFPILISQAIQQFQGHRQDYRQNCLQETNSQEMWETGHSPDTETRDADKTGRPLWFWFALAALGLTVLEWSLTLPRPRAPREAAR